MATVPIEPRIAHTTQHELRFLDDLGTFTRIQIHQKELLANYIRGSARRSDWGTVDKAAVIAHAEQLHAAL